MKLKKTVLTAALCFAVFLSGALSSCGEESVPSTENPSVNEQTDNPSYTPSDASSDNSGDNSTDNSKDDTGDNSGGGLEDDPVEEPKHTHTAVKVEATEPTCTRKGNSEYWYCAECGGYFSDETCSDEKDKGFFLLEKTAHSYYNGCCSVCGEKDPDYVPPSPSEGLSYALSDDGTYYILSGIGSCSDTEIVIPSTYEGLPVKEIGSYAFCAFDLESFTSLGSDITSVTILDGVERVGEGAFYGCISLVGVNLPESVSSIGDYAFSNCSSLVGITLPSGVATLGASAFYDCSSLVNVNMGSGLKNIGDGAFYLCDKLVGIIIPEGVTYIGAAALRGCSSLSEVKIGNGVENIGAFAFGGCVSLAEIRLPASVSSIGKDAFVGCRSLNSIIVDDECKNYKSVDGNLYSGDGEELIQYAVGRTDKNFTVPSGVKTIADDAFYGGRSLKSVTLPSGLTTIGDYAFNWCNSLESVVIPDGVTYIGDNAFENCSSLTSVVIGSGVSHIGAYAFHNCSSLGSAEFKNTSGWTVGGNDVSSDVLNDTLSAAACFTVNYYWLDWERS